MNNKIKPHYVDFNTAKLLKEKGFASNESKLFFGNDGFSRDKKDYNMDTGIFVDSYIERPTQDLVVEWLRVNHGIWIYIDMTGSEKFYPRYRYIDKNGQHYVGDFKDDNNERFLKDTPQEAYSAAFDYILNNNLI